MKTLIRAVNILAQSNTKNTQQYRYDFKGIATGPFREYTITHSVADLDPDGFVSDAATGDMIIDAIDWGERYISDDWESQGNHEYLSVWDPEEKYDREAEYMGVVIRTKVNAVGKGASTSIDSKTASSWSRFEQLKELVGNDGQLLDDLARALGDTLLNDHVNWIIRFYELEKEFGMDDEEETEEDLD